MFVVRNLESEYMQSSLYLARSLIQLECIQSARVHESVRMHAIRFELWIYRVYSTDFKSTEFVNNCFYRCFRNYSENHFEQYVIFREHERSFFRQVIKSDIKTHLNKKKSSISFTNGLVLSFWTWYIAMFQLLKWSLVIIPL